MKIFRTIESFYPKVTGPANQAFKISSELEKRSIESPVFTTDFDVKDVKAKEKIENVNVTRFPAKARLFKYIYSPDMKKTLRKDEFDIIHAHCYRSYQSDAAFSAAKRCRKKFVISTHGTLLSYRHFVSFPWNLAYDIYDLITLKKTVKKADAVVVNSSQEYEEAIKFGIRREKIHNIPVGIDADEYKTERKFEHKKELELLYVGWITRNRPVMDILKALVVLKEKKSKENNEKNNFSVKLNIIGSETRSSFSARKGYLDELKSFVVKNKLQNDVVFFPHKSKQELKEFYKNADVFVYPSIYESFGQPVLEAGASGLPVLCSEIGIVADLFEKKDQQDVLITQDAKQIAQKIEAMFDPELRRRLSKNTLKTINDKFTWKKIIDEYVKMYNSLRN